MDSATTVVFWVIGIIAIFVYLFAIVASRSPKIYCDLNYQTKNQCPEYYECVFYDKDKFQGGECVFKIDYLRKYELETQGNSAPDRYDEL